MNTNYPFNLIDAVFKDPNIGIDLRKIPAWLSHLTEREQEVIRMRYKEGLTLEEIGKEFNVIRERIRQYEAKALKKLAYPACKNDVVCISITEHEAAQNVLRSEIAELRRQHTTLREYVDNLENAIAKEIPSLTRILSVLPESHKSSESPLPDIDIEDMGLSIRSTTCLERAGFSTASEVAGKDKEAMMNVRILVGNLWKRYPKS